MLAAIGMEAFAERAHRELVATGEKVGTRGAKTRNRLAPRYGLLTALPGARAGRHARVRPLSSMSIDRRSPQRIGNRLDKPSGVLSALPISPDAAPQAQRQEEGDSTTTESATAIRPFRVEVADFNEVDRGGHFAAWEEPELFTAELRAAFKSLRRSS